MRLIERLDGEGEVQRRQGGASVGPCSYRLDVYQEEFQDGDVKGSRSRPGMQRLEIQGIALRSGGVLPRDIELILLLNDGRQLPFRALGSGGFEAMGGLL